MRFLATKIIFLALISASVCRADENLFGYLKGSETLPKGSWELYQFLTSRTDKERGTYKALDSVTEVEYGVTDKFTSSFGLKMLSVESKGLIIDGYLPKDIDRGLTLSGFEMSAKYNFLSAAKDDVGFSTYLSLDHSKFDVHSGQPKDTTSLEIEFLIQKYFLEGELIWVVNFGEESTYAERKQIDDLPAGFEWPTQPEMEIELKIGTGLTYRFLPSWFFGAETLYETEYETEIGQERWSTFVGPTLHYGSQDWWATLTWFYQVEGGGPPYVEQSNTRLHLIEKTRTEWRLKVGYNF